jgi:hypothetical protein
MGPYHLHAKSVANYVGPYHLHAKSVANYVGPYHLHAKSVANYVGPYHLHAKSVGKALEITCFPVYLHLCKSRYPWPFYSLGCFIPLAIL